MSNFYDELIKHDFYEKTASEKSNTVDMLENFSTDQIEAIAEELGLMFEKEAGEEETVEEKVKDSSAKTEEKKEEDKPAQPKAEETKKEAAESEETDKKTEGEETPKAKTEEKKEETKEASEFSEEEIIKVAYDIAGEKLASVGVSVADYVFSKIASEEMAIFIADKAEKLAFISDKNAYQVADDIMCEIGNAVSGEN